MVITDGRSEFSTKVEIQAKKLLDQGVRVFVVGVGPWLNHHELRVIASNPDCNHISYVEDFIQVDDLVDQIEKKFCDGR